MPKKLTKAPAPAPALSPTTSSFPLPPTATGFSTPFKPTTTSTTTTNTTASTPVTLTDQEPLPRLMVFDLDYTLWPFWIDTHVSPPLKPNSAHTSVQDKYSEAYAFYPEVPAILGALRAAGLKIGAASRTQAPDLAKEMLRLLHVAEPLGGEASRGVAAGAGAVPAGAGGWSGKEKTRKAWDYFDHLEIYPGSKMTHFERLKRASGVAYEDMLFFDDESRNGEVERLGVTMWLVRDGVTRNEVDEGVREWRRRRGLGGKEGWV